MLLYDPGQFGELRQALSQLNLIYRGDKGSEGGRLFVREAAPQVRTHHLHVYFDGAPEWENYLRFRDRLRASAEMRTEYAALKRRLAAAHHDDRFAYLAGKTAFVLRVLDDR